MKYCIIGAGAAGLAAARRMKERGIPFEVLERESDVGGIWDSSLAQSPIYSSTHLISSRPLTEYPGYPMAQNLPDYPHHSQVLQYFRSFAKEFDLYSSVQFEVTVQKVERAKEIWRVQLLNGEIREYAGLVLASGFTAKPNVPRFEGKFSGQVIHSKQYKNPDIFLGKRVLIIGAGNSGCDIATEAALHARKVFLSMRRGYHFIPKYIFGQPTDQIGELSIKLRVPTKVRKLVNHLILKATLGSPEKYGFPKPDHGLLESHPIINSNILQCAARGKVIPKPDLNQFQGLQAMFDDQSTEDVDLVILATGYLPEIPYMNPSDLNWKDDHPELYLHLFHPAYDNLFVLGMIQPDSGVWGIFDAQARAVTAYLCSQRKSPEKAAKFKAQKADLREDRRLRLKYLPSLRHHFEVEHSSYLKRLSKVERALS